MKKEQLIIDLGEKTFKNACEIVSEMETLNGAIEVVLKNIRERVRLAIDPLTSSHSNWSIKEGDIKNLIFSKGNIQFENGVEGKLLEKPVQKIIFSEGSAFRVIFENGEEQLLGIKFNEQHTQSSTEKGKSSFSESEALRALLKILLERSFPDALPIEYKKDGIPVKKEE